MKSCPLGLYNKNADEICVCPSVTTTTALATTSWKVAELNVTFACKKRTDERFSNALCFSQRQCYCQEQLSDTKGPYKLALFFQKTRANHIIDIITPPNVFLIQCNSQDFQGS